MQIYTIVSRCSRRWAASPIWYENFEQKGAAYTLVFTVIHIWTVVVDESEEWSSQLIFQFKQLERRSLKKSGLHSSVGRASHRYRGGHRVEFCWSPDFFRLLFSNCLNWKINCDDHSSLSSTTAVQICIISYIHYIISLLCRDLGRA